MINYRYRIIKKIGEGRSKVFLCEDEYIKAKVALKILPPNIDSTEKNALRQEYFYLKKFKHPNIIQSLNFGTTITLPNDYEKQFGIAYNSLFIVLEYFDGTTLADSLDIVKKEQIIPIINSISSVLFYLHQANFIYYDLKPENILIRIDDDKIDLKFIDFGLTRHLIINNTKNIMGSMKFIAPEVLNREARNHKADLYSLGVLIYRMLFKKYPIEFDDPLKIYKAQIEGKIQFPDSKNEHDLVGILKNLLNKNAGNRFTSSFDIISKLKLKPAQEFNKLWNTPKILAGKETEIELCNKYINDVSNYKPIRIYGPYNSGKSFLLNELHSAFSSSILLKPDLFIRNIPSTLQLLALIYFNADINNEINDELKEEVKKWFDLNSEIPADDFRSIIINIASSSRIILLIDDFHVFNPMDREVIFNILPLIIVNGGKVIWTGSDATLSNEIKLHNTVEIELKPFSEEEVIEFIDLNFAYFLPKEIIKELVLKNSEFLPGSIEKFIDDLVHNNIIVFDIEKGIYVQEESVLNRYLNKSLSEIYSEQFKNLSEEEKNVLYYFSLLQQRYEKKLLSLLCRLNAEKLEEMFNSFEKKNIGRYDLYSNGFEFYSPGLKLFIVTQIEKIEKFHRDIAEWLETADCEKDNHAVAFHYEKAGDFQKSYDYYLLELSKAKSTSAYNHMINLINHLLTLPFKKEQFDKLNYDLSNIYFLVGDMNACYQITEELLEKTFTTEEKNLLLIQKGNALVKLGEFQKGIDALRKVLGNVEQSTLKNEIKVAIAGASLYLNLFDETTAICNEMIKNNNISPEVIGKAYNLLGQVNLYRDNNLHEAIYKFSESAKFYEKCNDMQKLAGVKINIGNIYVMLYEYENARKNWDEAILLNKKAGNLEQEAKILLNYGILDYDLNEYEEAASKYERAKIIFENLGDRNSTGMAYNNLAEVRLKTCNYNLAMENIQNAQSIFEEINSFTELGETFFLKGLIYYKMYDVEELRNIYDSIKELIKNGLLPEKYSVRIIQIESLILDLVGKPKEVIKKLIELIEKLSGSDEREDNYNYTLSIFLLLKHYIQSQNFTDAATLIDDNKLKEISKHNKMIALEREYWTAKLKMESRSGDPISTIEKILENVEAMSITELTWKIMFLSGLYFFKRGNKIKADKYFTLTNALIMNIEKSIPTIEHLQKFQKSNEIIEVKRYCF